MKTVYIINEEAKIEPVNYEELVWQFVAMTKTPEGIAHRLHIRDALWFKVEGVLFDNEADADNEADRIEEGTGKRPAIQEVIRLEGWILNPRQFSKRFQVFDTREEADEWLMNGCLKARK